MAVRLLWRAVALFGLVALLASAGPTGTRAQGADDPGALNRQAMELQQAGRYAEAIEIVRKALVLLEEKRGPDHTDVGTSLNNLAWLYGAQGRYPEAAPNS